MTSSWPKNFIWKHKQMNHVNPKELFTKIVYIFDGTYCALFHQCCMQLVECNTATMVHGVPTLNIHHRINMIVQELLRGELVFDVPRLTNHHTNENGICSSVIFLRKIWCVTCPPYNIYGKWMTVIRSDGLVWDTPLCIPDQLSDLRPVLLT